MIYFRPNKRESEIIWNRERKVEIDSRDEEGEGGGGESKSSLTMKN